MTTTRSTGRDTKQSAPGVGGASPFFLRRNERGASTTEGQVLNAGEVINSQKTGHFFQSATTLPPIQRKCSHCEAEEQEVQRKEDDAGGARHEVSDGVADALGSGGDPLDDGTRSFMENRFGYDFSHVKVHTGAVAAKSAAAINALAYTSGSSIVFNENQYAPETAQGKKLLAHELTHVVQQNKVIYRCPDQASEQAFDTRASAIRGHDAYRTLPAEHRGVADEIITTSRGRDNCIHLIDQLTLLFNTPDNPPGNTAVRMRQETADSLAAEQARLATPEGAQSTGIEEAATASPARRWTRLEGVGAFYFVDRTDPNNIVVRAQVRLNRTGGGTTTDITNTLNLEDAIEKAAATRGYTLDIVFVNTSGPDVFNVNVNPNEWTVSTNWVGATQGLAHELHHLLRLDDRYDYIEAHAGNADMVRTERLRWFREQLGRAPDPGDSTSLMGSGSTMLDDDVCRVARLDMATCTAARTAPNPPPVSPNPCPSPGFIPTPVLPPLSTGAPVASPPALAISPDAAEMIGSIVLDSFILDSSALTPGHRNQLRTLAAFLRTVLAQHGGIINILGHADATGQESYNMGIAQMRADAVMIALAAEGIPVNIMFTCSAGDTQLLVPSSRQQPRNRRVEIRLRVARPAPAGTGAPTGTGGTSPILRPPLPGIPTTEEEFNQRLRRMLTQPLPAPAQTPTFNDVLRRAVQGTVSPLLDGLGIREGWLRERILEGAYNAVDRGIESALGSVLDAAGIQGEAREAIETSTRALRESHIPR